VVIPTTPSSAFVDDRSVLDWPPAADAPPADTYASYADVYDLLYDDVDDDIAFYLAAAGTHVPAGRALLEIGVGTGRLTARLLAAGHRVAGIDASRPMLDRAVIRFGTARLDLMCGDIRNLALGATFPLAIAPFGMVAHLLTDADRLAAYRNVYAHLEPGGAFIFDDCPLWLSGPAEDHALVSTRVRPEPNGNGTIRLLSNTIAIAGEPLSVRYDYIDRLDRDGRVARRTVARIVFRDITVAEELALLGAAGFARVSRCSAVSMGGR
jgi:SAM-dependent methyltransferase